MSEQTNSQQVQAATKSGGMAFVTHFVPGLVVGLLVGALAAAFLQPLIERESVKLPEGTVQRTQPSKPEIRDGIDTAPTEPAPTGTQETPAVDPTKKPDELKPAEIKPEDVKPDATKPPATPTTAPAGKP
jgi:outer membrane biosynthesis protein TonB